MLEFSERVGPWGESSEKASCNEESRRPFVSILINVAWARTWP